MIKLNLLAVSPLLSLLLVACTPVKDATDMRNKMAKRIAPAVGLETVWNTTAPLELGHIYYLQENGRGGKVLNTRYDKFVEATNTSQWRQVIGVDGYWRKDVDSSFSLKPQLAYMGLEASPSISNTRAIRFSAEGHERQSIRNFNSYETTVLNSDGTGIELRKAVLQDTQRLSREKLPIDQARYWIVTDLVTFKNLTVSFQSKPGASVDVSVADQAALKNFLAVNGLTSVGGTASGSVGATNESKVTSTSPCGLLAWCVPLQASEQDGRVVMSVDPNHPIRFANTLR